jgi:3-phenylpropionate/trans-cinnamate dioxygenase ferredoxin subunit
VFTILKKQKHNIGAEITSRDIPVIGQQKEGVVVFPRRMEITGSFHLGAVGDIKVGAMMKVKHRGDIHLLCRTSETEVRLASGMCTHGNAFLGEGTLSGNTVQCPKHNGQFDLGTGKATNKPATADLTVYNCEIIDGQITTDFKKRQDNA